MRSCGKNGLILGGGDTHLRHWWHPHRCPPTPSPLRPLHRAVAPPAIPHEHKSKRRHNICTSVTQTSDHVAFAVTSELQQLYRQRLPSWRCLPKGAGRNTRRGRTSLTRRHQSGNRRDGNCLIGNRLIGNPFCGKHLIINHLIGNRLFRSRLVVVRERGVSHDAPASEGQAPPVYFANHSRLPVSFRPCHNDCRIASLRCSGVTRARAK